MLEHTSSPKQPVDLGRFGWRLNHDRFRQAVDPRLLLTFCNRDEAWWERYIALDFVRHDPNLPFEVCGPASARRLGEMMHGGLSEVAFNIGDVVGEGDKGLVRLKMRARHTGEFMGTKPTNNWVDIDVMNFFRMGDGHLVEHWALMDNLSLLQQVGAVKRRWSKWPVTIANPRTCT